MDPPAKARAFTGERQLVGYPRSSMKHHWSKTGTSDCSSRNADPVKISRVLDLDLGVQIRTKEKRLKFQRGGVDLKKDQLKKILRSNKLAHKIWDKKLLDLTPHK